MKQISDISFTLLISGLPRFFIIAGIIGLCTGCVTKVIDVEKLSERQGIYFEEGQPEPFTGKGTASYANGNKEMEVNLVNGIAHGTWRSWHENGILKREFVYEDGDLVKFTTYFSNGNKLLYGEYKDGKAHGKNILWFKNGQKKFDVDFKNGVKHGLERHWHENGKLASEAEYLDGKKIKSAVWDQNGQALNQKGK